MARKPKVSDMEIAECLANGMRQNEIAEKYGVHPTSISQRVSRMKRAGTLPSKGGTPPENGECEMFSLMDTVVRKKDRKWFRITGIDEKYANLTELLQGESIVKNREVIDIRLDALEIDFEKKDYPKVKCYNLNDYNLNEMEEEKDMTEVVIAEPINEVEVPILEPSAEVHSRAKSDETEMAIRAAVMTTAQKPMEYTVKREFLRRIDLILDAVGADATDGIMEHTGRLIAKIIDEGVKAERNG
jgi:predicted DNA-binding protein YlxM (UPF0122 family)